MVNVCRGYGTGDVDICIVHRRCGRAPLVRSLLEIDALLGLIFHLVDAFIRHLDDPVDF